MKNHAWLAHVETYRSSHNCTQKEAMKKASKSWNETFKSSTLTSENDILFTELTRKILAQIISSPLLQSLERKEKIRNGKQEKVVYKLTKGKKIERIMTVGIGSTKEQGLMIRCVLVTTEGGFGFNILDADDSYVKVDDVIKELKKPNTFQSLKKNLLENLKRPEEWKELRKQLELNKTKTTTSSTTSSTIPIKLKVKLLELGEKYNFEQKIKDILKKAEMKPIQFLLLQLHPDKYSKHKIPHEIATEFTKLINEYK